MKPITTTSPADLVTACRAAAGLPTIYAAGQQTGESTGTYHKIESGKMDPSVGVLRRLLAAMGWRLVLRAERVECPTSNAAKAISPRVLARIAAQQTAARRSGRPSRES